MKNAETGLDQIKILLREHPKGMKITQIATEMGMNRNSVAKYLDILLMARQVEMLPFGMSKVYRLSRKTGVPTLLDGSPDLIVVLDGTRIVQANDSYLAFAGLDRDDVVGSAPSSPDLPGLSLPAVLTRIRQARDGESTRIDVPVTANGIEHHFSIRVNPTVLPEGKPGVTLVFEDITDKKNEEARLKASEADFRTLFGASTVGTAVYDASGQIVEANAVFLENYGVISCQEIGLLNLFSHMGMPAETLRSLRKGETVTFDSIVDSHCMSGLKNCRLPGSSGSTPLLMTITPIRLEKGGLRDGYLVQQSDSDPRMQKILDQVPDFVARFSRDLKYLSANQSMELVTGINPGACIGRTNSELGVPVDYAAKMDLHVREVFRTGRTVSFGHPDLSRGKEREFTVSLAPETSRGGEIISVLAITRVVVEKDRDPVPEKRENQKLLEGILGCIDEAVVLVGYRSGVISYVNPAAEKIFGYRMGEVFLGGQNGFSGYPRIEEYLEGNGFYETESALKGTDARALPATLHFRPIRDEKKSILDIVAIIRTTPGNGSPGIPLPVRQPPLASRGTLDGI